MTTQILRSLALAGALVVAIAGVASAHAALVSSAPPDGAVVPGVAMVLVANYDENLTTDNTSTIVVDDANGNQVANGTTNPNDTRQMTAALASLTPGAYVARWTAVTADDLGVSRGEIHFTVSAGPTPTPSPTPGPAPIGGLPLEWLVVLAAVVIGVALVVYLLRRPRNPAA